MKRLSAALFAMSALSCATSQRPLKEYVEENVPKFIQKQESKYGLKYEGRPEIKYMTGVLLDPLAGSYDESGKILLNADEIFAPRKFLGRRLCNVVDEVYPGGPKYCKRAYNTYQNDAEFVANHELVHSHNHEIRKKLGLPWPVTVNDLIIDEGVATFVALGVTGRKEDCSYSVRSSKESYEFLFEVMPETMSRIGSCVLGPIVEKYGYTGISYMLANPPADEEMSNMYTYRIRVMNELANRPKTKVETTSTYRVQ